MGSFRTTPLFLACIGLGLACSTPNLVLAQTRPAATRGTTSFAPADFAKLAPSNAWDMVSHLPGFTVVDPDEDVRGYAEARGNVLIDGARPTSKYQNAKDLLKRIPVNSVDRIELIQGDAEGIDMGGFSTVVNVVLQHAASHQLAIEGGLLASTDGWTAPTGKFRYGYRGDHRLLDLAVEVDPELDDDSGRGTLRTYAPDGSVDSQGALDTRTTKHKQNASVHWQQPLAAGKLTLDAAVRGEQENTGTHIRAASASDTEDTQEDQDSREFEAGARFVRDIGSSSTLKLMATQRLGRLDNLERSTENSETETFHEKSRTGESIGRIDLFQDWTPSLSTQASFEGAYNFIDSTARLQQQGVPVPLPGSDVRVEERRMEAALKFHWTLTPQWSLEAGLRMQHSRLSQTGDTQSERRFTHPKPRLAVHWDMNPANQLHLAISREVGQLDFEDFVASASLDTGMVSAGNAELEPERSRRLELGWKHELGQTGAFTLTWTHDHIDNVVDHVLVVTPTDTFDAPGNIGAGWRNSLALDFSLALDGIGLRGGQLHTSVQWYRSRVTDPVTGMSRPISGQKPVEGEINLTQSIPSRQLQWGLTLEHIAERKTKYRFDEIERESEGMGWTLFVERHFGPHWRLRAEATDLFGRDFTNVREKYDGPRSQMPLEEVERRQRTTPGMLVVTLRYDMGA